MSGEEHENYVRMELIEIIAWKSGLQFLSELKEEAAWCMVLHNLRKIQPEQYPLKDWNALASYLTDEEMEFETASAAKEFLLVNWQGKSWRSNNA